MADIDWDGYTVLRAENMALRARLGVLTDLTDKVIRRLENSSTFQRDASRSFLNDLAALRAVLDSDTETTR